MSTYYDLLNEDEWKNKRLEIIKRDNNTCTDCKRGIDKVRLFTERKYIIKIEKLTLIDFQKKDIPLQVHHKHYILGKAPWEYRNSDLITLCKECHQKLHDTYEVFVYKEIQNKLIKVNVKICKRCNGTGGFPEYEHVNHGKCFICDGAQFVYV